jgi:hypothetical protein
MALKLHLIFQGKHIFTSIVNGLYVTYMVLRNVLKNFQTVSSIHPNDLKLGVTYMY